MLVQRDYRAKGHTKSGPENLVTSLLLATHVAFKGSKNFLSRKHFNINLNKNASKRNSA